MKTESSIQNSIRNFLKSENWFVTKLHSTSTNGIPDLFAFKGGRFIFIEVKSGKFGESPEKGLSPLQKVRIEEMRNKGAEVFIINNLQIFKKELYGN